jgi:hypothetical protein
VAKALEGKGIKTVIVRPPKLVNIVLEGPGGSAEPPLSG